jgi:hypothetical protein
MSQGVAHSRVHLLLVRLFDAAVVSLHCGVL